MEIQAYRWRAGLQLYYQANDRNDRISYMS